MTQEHIENGIRGSCANCPIALAIAPFNKVWYVSGYRLRDTYYAEDAERYVYIPCNAVEFIENFDNARRRSKPFSFNLSANASCHDPSTPIPQPVPEVQEGV